MLLPAGLALCGAGLWLLLSPPQYRATTRIDANPDVINANGNTQDVSYNPYFIQVEFQVIQSQAVLSRVVAKLNLDVAWSRKYGGSLTTNDAMAILKRHLQITLVRNTKLIGISFTSGNPDEAAKIANAIAEAYQDHRFALRATNVLNGIRTLEEEFQKEEQTIKAKQDALDQLRKQLNVPSPEPADELLKSNYPAYLEAKRELQKLIDFHKLLQRKIEQEKVALEIPNTAMVQIIDVARPPQSPVSPNRCLGLGLLALGVLSTVCGWRFLKSPSLPSAVAG